MIGRILSFKKLEGKGKKTQYSSSRVNLTTKIGKIGALCNWYNLKDDTISLAKSSHDFYDVDNYCCTIPDPIHSDTDASKLASKYIVTPAVVQLMKSGVHLKKKKKTRI